MRQKAENKMKQIEAKEVIKTLNWIAQADEDGQSVLEPKRNRNGIYECLVHLPLIEKTVIGIGDYKLESIDNATKQSSKLIFIPFLNGSASSLNCLYFSTSNLKILL